MFDRQKKQKQISRQRKDPEIPRFPRDVNQDQAVRAFVRAGGIEVRRQGKGSHRVVRMPNGQRVVLPVRLKTGLLRDMIKESGMTVEEFIELL